MSTIAKLSNLSLLKVGDGAGTEAFTTVPEVKKISGPVVKFDLLDASSHDSAGLFREWIPGFSDGDMIRAAFNWRASNTVHKNLRIDNYAATRRNFKIVYADTADNNVLCATFIQTLEPEADAGDLFKANVQMKVTGAPGWS